jgi:hypothetical protein
MAEHANCDLIRRLYAARARDDRPEDQATSDAFFEGGIDG